MENIQQIKFYELPPSDIERDGFEITIEDSVAEDLGEASKNNMRDRSVSSKWLTTGSSDLGNTRLTFAMGDQYFVDTFIVMACNFKSYVFEYFDGSTWQVSADVTNNEDDYIETAINLLTDKIRITIRETIVPNAEKFIGRIFVGTLIGQLQGWPVIKPKFDFDHRSVKMLSGKSHVVSKSGGFSFGMRTKVTSIQEDFDLLEKLFFSFRDGVFAQLSGGSRNQFAVRLTGYDPNFIYKVKPIKDYKPEFYKGIYSIGATFNADFVEVV